MAFKETFFIRQQCFSPLIPIILCSQIIYHGSTKIISIPNRNALYFLNSAVLIILNSGLQAVLSTAFRSKVSNSIDVLKLQSQKSVYE